MCLYRDCNNANALYRERLTSSSPRVWEIYVGLVRPRNTHWNSTVICCFARRRGFEYPCPDSTCRSPAPPNYFDLSTGVSADTKHPGAEDDDTIPMIQLASYALHKLFSEWESDGHLVPLLRPPAAADAGAEAEAEAGRECGEAGAGAEGAGAEAAVAGEKRKRGKGGPKAKKAKVLPGNAGSMHPCMLLTYMRPALEYRDVAAEGDRPQNMLYTVALDVDGQTYLGKGTN